MPHLYDFVAAAVFAPFGGLRRLRRTALDRIGICPGDRLLELGCGTGGVTKMLLERGADVDALDGSQAMLRKARRRAAGATFSQCALEELRIDEQYDLAIFAFVLHELPQSLRVAVIRQTLRACRRVAILDHAVPASGLASQAWRRLLLALEPETVRSAIEGGFRAEIRLAGGKPHELYTLANGTAMLIIVEPPVAPRATAG